MRSGPTTTNALLIAIAALLLANLLWARPGAPAAAPALLPAAHAQNRPVETQLRTGTTFVTASVDGAQLYVWQCTLVNALPTFQAFSFTAR
ncbi:MAG: hypothetical protein M9894_37095 [Planctomycetes bacterium]|nr:hypothetical protein [Planctomycetota bacterium]